MNRKTKLTSAIGLITILLSNTVFAVAYCALRDPTDAIHHFYPELSRYEALDGKVDEAVREHLTGRLANLHFDEFGTHTLYAVYSDSGTSGFVHARTEKGDWGLDEMVWSLNPDLSIADFRFQRTRSRHAAIIEGAPFVAWLSGRNVDDLVQLLDGQGLYLRERPAFVPDEAERLAVTAIRSAIKTILVTQFVWGDTIGATS